MSTGNSQTKVMKGSKMGIAMLKESTPKMALIAQKQSLIKELEEEHEKFVLLKKSFFMLLEEEKKLDSDCLRYSEKIFKGKQKIEEMKKNIGNAEVFLQENPYLNQLAEQVVIQQTAQEHQNHINPDAMSYEQLLELGERIGKVSKGLTSAEIQNLKKTTYKRLKGTIEEKCSVCYEEYRANDTLIQLKCKHCYHEECLVGWLKGEKVCPLCKQYIM